MSDGTNRLSGSEFGSPDGDETKLPATSSGERDASTDWIGPELPAAFQLGRYEIQRRLGSGGFGTVLLARDTELDRLVAIKLPNPKRFADRKVVRSFMKEAKMAAKLRHQGIVTVFDVGWSGSIPFIVLEFVQGQTLAQFLRSEVWTYEFAARTLQHIAEALHHAHTEGFVHRDLKPQNILLDGEDHPRISDFGLAVKATDIAFASSHVIGTPRYMAPEQARGENHRIDRRTDIWGLGVILYQLLCRTHPFDHDDVGDAMRDIVRGKYVSPLEVSEEIPHELARICTRCLSRRMSERYRSADELARELRLWLNPQPSGGGAPDRSATADALRPVSVVPRGLRSFKPEDGAFFQRLLPGPRDRNGLPLNLSFWINLLDQTDSEATVPIGLLYGPSGSGKSSFIRAGVIPLLNPTHQIVYVDATGTDLTARLDDAVANRFPDVTALDSLADKIMQLRERSTGLDRTVNRQKVIVLIDQFEQWLSAADVTAEHPLVRALRQCDGGTVQCVLIVRDDFWLSISRFMNLMEISIADGENAMLIDSFDADHARGVLCELGRSMNCLPRNESEMTEGQRAFVRRAIDELSRDGRLYPVRLTIFAELVRGHPWNAATMDQLGGTQGIGVSYLDREVGRESTAARRVHSDAARRVLAELLPAVGDIKQSLVTRERLLEVSGYAESPRDFDSLMRLLNRELRLLTPVRADAQDESHDSDSESGPFHRVTAYRLTHDFLIPSIRQWLDRDLRGRRAGRLQLLLNEQATIWADRRSKRYLPTWSEYLLLRLYTRRRSWTAVQARMMNAAAKRITRQAAVLTLAGLLVVAIAAGVYSQHLQQRRLARSVQLLRSLDEARVRDIPGILDALQATSVEPAYQVFRDSERTISHRVRAGLACLRQDDAVLDQLVRWVTDPQLRADEVQLISKELSRRGRTAIPPLKQRLTAATLDPLSRLKLASVLAELSPDETIVDEMQTELVETLVQQSGPNVAVWLEMLQAVGKELVPTLEREFNEDQDLRSARVVVAALDRYTEQPETRFPRMIRRSNGPQFRAIHERFADRPQQMLGWLRASAGSRPEDHSAETARGDASWALACLALGDPQPFFTICHDTNSPRRTLLIEMMNSERMDLWQFINLMEACSAQTPVLAAFVLASNNFVDSPLSQRQFQHLQRLVHQAVAMTDNPETHVAADLMCQRWGFANAPAPENDASAPGSPPELPRRVFRDSQGQGLIVLDVPAKAGRPAYRAAVGIHEVSVGLLRKFERQTSFRFRVPGRDDAPAQSLPLKPVAAFCNWLSEQERIPEEDRFFNRSAEEDPLMFAPNRPVHQTRGYRPLTLDEWIVATGGGTRHWLENCGIDVVQRYVWERGNARWNIHPVGQRLPNPQGFIDLFGNVEELVLKLNHPENVGTDGRAPQVLYAVGGSALTPFRDPLAQDSFKPVNPKIGDLYLGFRVARTLEPIDQP